MSHAPRTQREWLMEDLEQIERYFPGSELLEAVETPFDIHVPQRAEPVAGRETAKEHKYPVQTATEKSANRSRPAHELRRYRGSKRSEFLFRSACVFYLIGGLR